MGAGSQATAESSAPRLTRLLNSFVRTITMSTAWLNLLLVFVILAQVVLRYGFSAGQVALEELMWHLFAVAFMFGIAHAVTTDSHIRVDLASSRLGSRGRALIEVLGTLLLLFPFLWILFDHSLEAAMDAYRDSERSISPQGLGQRWLIRSVIPATCVLIALAALARVIESLAILTRRNAG